MTESHIAQFGHLLAIPAQMGVGAIAGLINTGSKQRRRLAFSLVPLAFAVPFMAAPEHRFVRMVAAAGVIAICFRSLDLYFDDRQWSAGRRVWLMLSVFDSRRVTFGPRRFDTHSWGMALGFLVLALGGAWLATMSPLSGWPRWAARWLGGALLAYAFMDGVAQIVRAAHAGVGITVPPLHRHPIAARTVSEFWNRRWNVVVHELLDRYCFRPLARRRHVRLGLVAAFLSSALMHFWLVIPPLGPAMAVWMGGFFAVNGAVVLVENKLGVVRWRPALAHAWTAVCLLATAPLFVEPFVQIVLE